MANLPKTNIIPWEDVIITVEPPEDVTEQGVIIAQGGEEEKRKKPEKGIVVAIGPPSDKDKPLPKDLKIGDLLFYERYTSNKIPDAGTEFNFVRFKFVMGFKKL